LIQADSATPEAENRQPSPKSWETFVLGLPFGLVGAILWLAALLGTRWGLSALLRSLYGEEWLDQHFHTADTVVWVLFTAVLLIWVVFIRRKPLWSLGFSLSRLPGDLGFTLVGALVMGAVYLLLLGGVRVFFGIASETPSEAFEYFLRSALFSRGDLLFILAVVLIYPIFEEIWFRGVVYGPMRREFGRTVAIIGGALLFAFSHDNLLPVNQFIGGLAFGIAYEMRRTLVAPILLHIAGNGTLAAMAWLLPKWGLIS
jgi:membrane protease YdiL (CAAX protease family)